jgi:DNA repair protein RadC
MEFNQSNTTFVREVRVQYRGKKKRTSIRSAIDIAAFFRKVMPDNSQEHFMAAYLDSSHSIIGYAVVTTGLANSTQIHPRELYQRAVLLGAVAVIAAHNHPSGSRDPSSADKEMTKKLKAAGEIIDIRLLDHVIVTEDSFFSFNDECLI